MDVDEPLKRIVNPNNIVDRIQSVDDRTLAGASASVESGNELFSQLDDQFGGRFISPTGESLSGEPTDEEFSGSVLSGNGVTPFDEAGTFNLAIINDGETTYGVGKSGTYSNGMDFFNRQLATGTSTDQRQLRSGFQELQGNDDPSYIFEFLDTAVGANLITSNPDFETGDATGWTLAGTGTAVVSSSVVSLPSSWEDYSLRLATATNCEATSNKYACSVGSVLNVSFEARHGNGTVPDSYFTVYIRFYNAVPTLLSSVIILSKTTEALPLGVYSAQVVVPVGATQFDIYIDRTTELDRDPTYFDFFNVQVVTISNEFGFHGEDGQILMGNGKFKTNDLGAYIPRGSLSGVVYANNTRTNISTSGNTTVFDLTVPANFFSKGHIRIYFDVFTDANANARTLTPTLTLGASTAVLNNLGTGANSNRLMKFQATIGKGGTNIQDIFFVGYRIDDNTTSIVSDGQYTQAGETESGTIALSLTLSLSGSVDAGWYNNVKVETVMNVEAW